MTEYWKDLVEDRNGWVWPRYDWGCWTFLTSPKRANFTLKFSEFTKNKKVVIQAGGNAGMYPKQYEDLFETVYTFEPDPLNFFCLSNNTTSKTIKFQACLGNDKKLVNLSNRTYTENVNSGGIFVQGEGNIPTLKIDDLNLSHCDLIHLDIEGYEKEALMGGAETIQKFSPVIVLELIHLSERYGTTDQEIHGLLKSWGYVNRGNFKNEDFIFIKE